jgi:hypothetical protein
MKTRSWMWIAVAVLPAVLSNEALSQSVGSTDVASSDVYIQQSRGLVAPGAKVLKPPPEAVTTTVSPNTGPTAPVTCNAQNASSSQACYTATQQARPASR